MLEIKMVAFDHQYSELIRQVRDDVFIKEQCINPEIEFDGLTIKLHMFLLWKMVLHWELGVFYLMVILDVSQ